MEPLREFYVDLSVALAGLAGGAVKSLVMKESRPSDIIPSMIAGALTANYLGQWASNYIGIPLGATAFIVGVCAMVIVQVLMETVRRIIPSFLKGSKPDAP